ncbi:hypothetical protein GcM1_245153 [Golovinomyces cichoracearum]|uniref:BAG domain-containing protein n=1 Tax=Golovinomyces cichoracearum TaxID=62708 RepID=A0A420IFD0_9PEZI|nr:hypothetical protein GcM1_245153 [Golovinomyces cichoracearum]
MIRVSRQSSSLTPEMSCEIILSPAPNDSDHFTRKYNLMPADYFLYTARQSQEWPGLNKLASTSELQATEVSSPISLPRSIESLKIYFHQIFSGLIFNCLPQPLAVDLKTRPDLKTFIVVSTLISLILFSIIISMTSWARSFWSGSRPKLSSPFGSKASLPNVTEDDYSYITSADIKSPERTYDPSQKPQFSSGIETKEDILVVRSKGVNYPIKFPANSIEEGKLQVRDVKNRLASIMELKEVVDHDIKLLYKGQDLNDNSKSCRDYGLKSHSEILCTLDESPNILDNPCDVSENMEGTKKKQKKRGKKGKKAALKNKESDIFHQNAAINVRPASIQKPQGPMDKLNALSDHFRSNILPLCNQFNAAPPPDTKKREFEHKKLSETIMNEVLLKLDAVEVEGDNESREFRRSLVREVQGILNDLDSAVLN